MLSNSTQKLLWFEISKMLIAAKEKKCIVLFIVIFSTLSFPIGYGRTRRFKSSCNSVGFIFILFSM